MKGKGGHTDDPMPTKIISNAGLTLSNCTACIIKSKALLASHPVAIFHSFEMINANAKFDVKRKLN